MKIVIIGAGWYGLHSYITLKKLLGNTTEIIILEKTESFFENSSNFNQNRLHLGYHYPRSSKTRNLCVSGYKRFIENYGSLIDIIDKNYYLISNNSNIDYETYIKIFQNEKNYDHTIMKNTDFSNIDGNIINTKEKVINSEKVKNYFISNIDMNNIKFGYNVTNIDKKDDKIILNNSIECDLCVDCTYNQLNISKKTYIYEQTISLLYDRINFDLEFDSITIMDGDFFSLYPRDIEKNKYTLTHVKYSPLIKSYNILDIHNYKLDETIIVNIIKKMEHDVNLYYSDFNKHFKYSSYFISYKCKLISNNDTRECVIEECDNIINVNCGKIIGIFELEDYLQKYIYDKLNHKLNHK